MTRVKLANNLKSARKFAALADIFARFGSDAINLNGVNLASASFLNLRVNFYRRKA